MAIAWVSILRRPFVRSPVEKNRAHEAPSSAPQVLARLLDSFISPIYPRRRMGIQNGKLGAYNRTPGVVKFERRSVYRRVAGGASIASRESSALATPIAHSAVGRSGWGLDGRSVDEDTLSSRYVRRVLPMRYVKWAAPAALMSAALALSACAGGGMSSTTQPDLA